MDILSYNWTATGTPEDEWRMTYELIRADTPNVMVINRLNCECVAIDLGLSPTRKAEFMGERFREYIDPIDLERMQLWLLGDPAWPFVYRGSAMRADREIGARVEVSMSRLDHGRWAICVGSSIEIDGTGIVTPPDGATILA